MNAVLKLISISIILTLLAVWLANEQGQVTINWCGWHVETTTAFSIIILLLLSFALWQLAKLFAWLHYTGARRVERRLRIRQQAGLHLLTVSFNALAGQDLRLAVESRNSARRQLGAVPLIAWLSAQIATAREDHKAAASEFLTLTQDQSAANLGWRGLMAEQLAEQLAGPRRPLLQTQFARALADKALVKQRYLHEARLSAAAGRQDWDEMRQALTDAERHRALTKSRIRQIEQVMLMLRGQALHLIEPIHKTSNQSQTRLLLERAYRLSPDFVPAALAFIDALLEAKQGTEAGKIIATAWVLQPQAALLPRFVLAYNSETALARLQRFERFAVKCSEHYETQLALAELSLAAELFGKAKTHAERAQLLDVQSDNSLLSAISQAARANLPLAYEPTQAATILGYKCQLCQTPYLEYQALCKKCGAFATLVSKT